MMNIAVNANVKIINVDYSLAPESPFPKALNEGYSVIKYTKEHADELGIDPDRIAAGGHSAGGNFSAAIHLMDLDEKKLDLKCLIMDYPTTDCYTDPGLRPKPKEAIPVSMCRFINDCYCIDKEERKNPLMSPVFADAKQLSTFPPTLIITCAGDSLYEEGEKFKDMLLKAGAEVTHKQFDAIHGFNSKAGADADESWQMMINHLKQHL